jgi:hypothetical protein
LSTRLTSGGTRDSEKELEEVASEELVKGEGSSSTI